LEGHQRDDNPNFPVKDSLEGLKDLDYKSLIWSVCFSPDGKYLASACVDSDVILWDVISGAKIWKFNLPNDASTVAFAQTEHGTRLAAGSSAHHTVTLFDANFDDVSGKHTNGSSRTLALLGGHSDWVIDVAFNEDASRLASAARDKTVRVWDATAAENLREARFHAERCWSLVYSDDGKWLASASDDFKVRNIGRGCFFDKSSHNLTSQSCCSFFPSFFFLETKDFIGFRLAPSFIEIRRKRKIRVIGL